MFESKEVITRDVNRVWKILQPLDRGDVLPWERIEQATGLARYTGHWGTLMKRLRNRCLRDRGIALWPVTAVGYRLCTPDEQLNLLARKRQSRALRQCTRAVRELTHLPNEELTVNETRLKTFRLERLRQTRRAIMRAARQSEEFRKSETLPRNARTPS